MTEENSSLTVPLYEKLKGIPGIFGIRLGEGRAYDVLTFDGEVEIRSYRPLLLASITVNGSFDHARMEAFMALASYIFGKNKDKKHLKMTTPVLQEESNIGIPMKSPVLHKPTRLGWTMSFVLPVKYTLATAPTPKDRRIHLFTQPARVVACLRYSGVNSQDKIKKYSAQLLRWLSKNHLYDPIGEIQSAEYDGPSTIPFLRKNEVLIEVNGP
jgi:hypothetical protein